MVSISKNLRTFIAILLLSIVVGQTISFWQGDVASNIAKMKAGTYNPYREFNVWLNDIMYAHMHLNFIPNWINTLSIMDEHQKYYFTCYMRDLVAGTIVYWMTAGGWHIIIYKLFRKSLFDDKNRKLPSWDVIFHQMWLAQRSLLVYAMLPIISEILIENNLTKVYFYVEQIGGWTNYAICFVSYLSLVEICIYWMHRTLHTNKWLYNNIHGPHHYYNKKEMLTPWASIAFHPIDGMLQASPYVVCLFIIPMHYYTHMCMLFFTSMWATNIHDAMWGYCEPIMGSKYHTVHHTHFVYNYGQFFTFCDQYWGTLRVPERTKSD